MEMPRTLDPGGYDSAGFGCGRAIVSPWNARSRSRAFSTIAATWLVGGALAAVAGVCYGINNQVSPVMGRDLVLSLFAAVIVGGIGSIHGAVAGGFIVGLASSLSVLVLPSGYTPAVPFVVILVTLYAWPRGLFGGRA